MSAIVISRRKFELQLAAEELLEAERTFREAQSAHDATVYRNALERLEEATATANALLSCEARPSSPPAPVLPRRRQ